IGTSDMACAQSTSGSGSEIAAVRSYHHALRRLEIESFAGGEVNTRLRFVIACNFGAQDGIPRKIVTAGGDGHTQKNIISLGGAAEILAEADSVQPALRAMRRAGATRASAHAKVRRRDRAGQAAG